MFGTPNCIDTYTDLPSWHCWSVLWADCIVKKIPTRGICISHRVGVILCSDRKQAPLPEILNPAGTHILQVKLHIPVSPNSVT